MESVVRILGRGALPRTWNSEEYIASRTPSYRGVEGAYVLARLHLVPDEVDPKLQIRSKKRYHKWCLSLNSIAAL